MVGAATSQVYKIVAPSSFLIAKTISRFSCSGLYAGRKLAEVNLLWYGVYTFRQAQSIKYTAGGNGRRVRGGKSWSVGRWERYEMASNSTIQRRRGRNRKNLFSVDSSNTVCCQGFFCLPASNRDYIFYYPIDKQNRGGL